MTVRHTPMPWIVRNRGEITTKDKCCIVAQCGSAGDHTDDTMDANAHLIAAAPDLLAALEAMVEPFENFANPPHPVPMARAAIAKAKGEES